jgi:hypothetical protein
MANVASAPPGKLKESVTGKTASSTKAVAERRTPTPTATATVVASRTRAAVAPKPAAAKVAVAPKPAAAKVAVPPKPAAPTPVPKPTIESTAATNTDERASALAFLGDLASEVSKGTVNLPCFPDVVMRIRKALAAPDVGLTEIVKIVGTEPRLAARLLPRANI